MMMKNILKLEQQMLDIWKVVDDIDLVYRSISDRPDGMTEDEIQNILLGMSRLYSLKFEEMHNTFEELCEENRKLKDNEGTQYDKIHL